MASNTRHGRRIPLPSTRQIRHELLVMELQELMRAKALEEERNMPPRIVEPAVFS